jgi:predicted permease
MLHIHQCKTLLAALHVELGLVVSSEAAPVLLVGSNPVVANGVGLVGLVERREPENIEAPIQSTAKSLVPVSLLVLVASLGSASIVATITRPASF